MIGQVTCECMIYDAQSLKEKRAVLKRILTRLTNKLNVSVAEIAYQDTWQRTKIAIVTVASARVAAERELSNALKLLDSFPEMERTITKFEWL
ncbi:DUF503 family protein [Bacillaceae bacterium Marseille-Q3522]|nr:DUF503 family protein [Bacillaceae bacterium Marseille-Q3522]